MKDGDGVCIAHCASLVPGTCSVNICALAEWAAKAGLPDPQPVFLAGMLIHSAMLSSCS